MSAGGSLLLSDVSNVFPSQRDTSTYMVSVVKITTFFIKVFSDPPRLDLERSKSMTAARVAKSGAVSQTASRSSREGMLTCSTDQDIQDRTCDSPRFCEFSNLHANVGGQRALVSSATLGLVCLLYVGTYLFHPFQ